MERFGGLAIVIGLAIVPGAHAQTDGAETPIALAPDAGQETRTLNFGDERGKKGVTVRFVTPAPLDAAPEVDLTDAQTSTGEKLDGDVTPRAPVLKQGDRTVLVTVVVQPASSAEPGSYGSELLLRGADIADARSQLSIALAAQPVDGAWLFAILLLLGGASLGVVGRIVATQLVELRRLQDRLATVEAIVAGRQHLPRAFRLALVKARTQIELEDATGAATTLTDLEAKAEAAAAADDDTLRLQELVGAQERSIAGMPNLGAAAAGLREVLRRELLFADEFGANDYSTDAGGTRRKARLEDVQRFSAFLHDYAAESKRQNLDAALELFRQGKFAEGEKAWSEAVGVEAPLGAAAGATAAPSEPLPVTERKRSLRNWIVRNAPNIWLAITALAIGLLGVFAVYEPSTTFRSEPFLDAVELFAWGFGSALAGIGISDLASKLTAGRPAPA